ncbi:MAG: class I SAM-dependent methyltransferase [Rhodobacteraceae bacterium]|nr:class I SAM-dependent methyltransferase [Paracoccaceae bacterium]
MHSYPGQCPVCHRKTHFISDSDWLRDNLRCEHCQSIPRERAFAVCLDRYAPNWRDLALHECSPADRSISARMRRDCEGYIGSQFFDTVPRGQMHDGFRSEDLEAMTFADASLDLHCHLDVLEHVNHPDRCFAEMARTLKPGGRMIFTTPYYPEKLETQRRAAYGPNGERFLLFSAEFHGNPISDEGALVTFHYGVNFPDLIRLWAPDCVVEMVTLTNPDIGVLGSYRDVFIVTKRGV